MGRLADLKRGVQTKPGDTAQQEKVAKQFEALFLQMMIKRMREAGPKDELFHSQTSDMVQSMADEQLALNLSKPGIGLAQALLTQMRQNQPAPADGADATAQAGQQAAAPKAGAPNRQLAGMLEMLRNNQGAGNPGAVQDADGAIDMAGFVARMSNPAQAAAAQSGVSANLILGQAALESGWGQREIMNADGTSSHNLFGIKAGADWKGKVANVTTTEYVNGVAQKTVQPFRSYGSYQEAFADYANLIGGSSRYGGVAQASTDNEAAHRIQQAGYATDPHYAAKLIRIMGQVRASMVSASSVFGDSP
ncbi:MAG TPA: flagellar assembly peptidoglycan hydrolase FlgJ [Rhodopila sp.]